MKTDRIDKVDLKYVPVDPEAGFSPEHNRDVIKRTIEWTEKMAAKKDREYQDSLRERTSAFAQYATDFEKGRTDTKIEKYFGKDYLTYLRGQQILDKIKKASNA
jgi:hypothetical protein